MMYKRCAVIITTLLFLLMICGIFIYGVCVTFTAGSTNIVISDDTYIKTMTGYHKLIDANYQHNYDYVLRNPTKYDAKIMSAYLAVNEEDRATIAKDLYDLSNKIVEEAECRTDYDKVLAIAKWVGYNLYYDRDTAEIGVTSETISMKEVLATKRATCAGFTNFFGFLCAAQNINVYTYRGGCPRLGIAYEDIESVPMNHEWSCVLIDDRYMFVDVTWLSGNYVENGEKKRSKRLHFDYFDMQLDFMSIEHRIMLSEDRSYIAVLASYMNEEAHSEG